MTERSWVDENGKALPLEDCTKEQLIDRIRSIVTRHQDERAAWNGKEEALLKRLKDHRKAKAEANKRADTAIKAMQQMLEVFQMNEIKK
jgi:hypothetical protein